MKIIQIFIILLSFFCANLFAEAAPKKPLIFTSRGIIYTAPYRAQENSIDAILAVKQYNLDHPDQPLAGSEVHVVVVKPQNPSDPPIFVCSHDENLIDLTGQNINLHDLSKEQIQNLLLLQVLDGVDYGKQRHFTFFEDVLNGVMQDKPFIVWLNVKEHYYKPVPGQPSYTATELIKALKSWRIQFLRERNIDIFKHMIVSSDNPFLTQAMLEATKTYHVEDLKIFPDYPDYILPPVVWDQFFKYGGYEKEFHFSPEWVALQTTLITKKRVDDYHQKGIKVLCWGGDCTNPDAASMYDAILGSY